jgi:NitT/TauT family transport system substrate-binding protein
LITSLYLQGCARGEGGQDLEKVSIAFQSWPGYGLWYLAGDKGFFRDEGLDVLIVNEEVDSVRRDAMKQGMLDCEAGTIDLLVSKRAQGLPIVAVMELDHSDGADGIVVSQDVRSISDLAGKTAALAQDDVGDTSLSHILDKNGMSRDKIKIAPRLPDDVGRSFLNKEADAAATWEPQLSGALERPGSRILVTTKDEHGIIVDTLNFREDVVKTRPKAVKSMMRSWFRALAYYRDHPDESSVIIARYYNLKPDDYRKAVEGLDWDDYRQETGADKKREWIGAFNAIARLKYGNGRIGSVPDASGAFDTNLPKTIYEDSQ